MGEFEYSGERGDSSSGKPAGAIGAKAPADSVMQAYRDHWQSEPDKVICNRVVYCSGEFETVGITYAETAARALAYRMAFQKAGLRAGDRILLSVSDPHIVLCCILGAASAGMVNATFTPRK